MLLNCKFLFINNNKCGAACSAKHFKTLKYCVWLNIVYVSELCVAHVTTAHQITFMYLQHCLCEYGLIITLNHIVFSGIVIKKPLANSVSFSYSPVLIFTHI